MLGAACNEGDCEAAPKQGQRPLLPEAMYERNDPTAALQGLSQRPASAGQVSKHAVLVKSASMLSWWETGITAGQLRRISMHCNAAGVKCLRS